MPAEPTHFFAKDCRDFDDGNEVQALVGQYDDGATEETFFHPKDIQVSFDEFHRLTGVRRKSGFCGIKDDVAFWYDPKLDAHFFYTRSGRL